MLRHILRNAERALIAVLLAAMTLMVFAGVVSRYLLHQSLSYMEELVRYLFVWATFLGAAAATQQRAHLGLTYLGDRLSGSWRRRLDYFVGAAQIATWLSPLAPKGVGAALTAGSGSVFGVSTAQNWDSMSTVNKVASVAVSATLFVSGVRGVLQPSFKPVTIPLKDGGKAVVWSGLSIRGQRAIGIAVADDERTSRQGRADKLRDVLGARRRI